MSYSEHRALQQLHRKVDEYTSLYTNIEFSGSGLNDLSMRGAVFGFRQLHIQIRISRTDVKVDVFDWSDNSGRTWRATGILITGEEQLIGYGIKVRFNSVRGHTLNDMWKFTASQPESLEERDIAYDWVNNILRPHVTVPISSPSKVVVSAEANYAVFLILRMRDDANAEKFREEAERLLAQYIIAEEATQGGPRANSENVLPTFTKGKYDYDEDLVGRTMGRSETERGSLDDW